MDKRLMGNTRVALINPGTNAGFAMQEPLNLGFLASYLAKHGIEVIIIDELAGDPVNQKLQEFKPAYAGITATTPLIPDAYRHADTCRRMGIKTILGGVHASIMTEEALTHADIVVKGEGETALLDIVTGRETGKIVTRPYIKNIDDIPRPSYNLINMEFYLRTKERIPYNTSLFFARSKDRIASMITSRGCPHACTFCHNSWKGTPYRFNSAERVIEDIKYLINTYRIDTLFFSDDNFFANKPRLLKICESIRKDGLKFSWGCNARVDNVTPETLAAVKEAGCRQVTFGFESGSQRMLDLMNKRSTVEQNRAAVAMCNKAGLLCVGTLMLGSQDETRKDIALTRSFIAEADIDCIGLCIAIPYPGTDIWNWCREKGRIPDNLSWYDFIGDRVPIRLNEHMSPEEIESYRSKIYLEFALKRKQFFNLLFMSAKNPVKSFKKAAAAFKHLFS